MALGRFHFSQALDSATNPDDTTVFAAPSSNAGKPERTYIVWASVNVTTEQAGATIALENGVGGARLGVADAASPGTTELVSRGDGDEGIQLSENTLLNATIEGATGVVATVVGEAVVKGGW